MLYIYGSVGARRIIDLVCTVLSPWCHIMNSLGESRQNNTLIQTVMREGVLKMGSLYICSSIPSLDSASLTSKLVNNDHLAFSVQYVQCSCSGNSHSVWELFDAYCNGTYMYSSTEDSKL